MSTDTLFKVGDVVRLKSGEIPQQGTNDGGDHTWLGARAEVIKIHQDEMMNFFTGQDVLYEFEIVEDDREGRLLYGHTDGPLDVDGFEFDPENVWKGIAYPDEVELP